MTAKDKNLKKQVNQKVTPELLEIRGAMWEQKTGKKQKWVMFCEYFLVRGYSLRLYEAKKTVSKYITLHKPKSGKRRYKVRFSNHRPIRDREVEKDCDFFVGVTHLGVSTARDAAIAVRKFFNDTTN